MTRSWEVEARFWDVRSLLKTQNSYRFEPNWSGPVRVRFGSASFSKTRFKFGSFSVSDKGKHLKTKGKIYMVNIYIRTERKRTNEYIGKIPLNNSYDIIRCISQHKKKISKICLLFIKWTTREQSNISIFLYNCKILKNIQKAFTGKSTTFYWKYEFLNHQTELITEILILILNN